MMPQTKELTPEVRAQVLDILTRLLDERLDIVSGCRQLTDLHHQGYASIPVIFVGLDSMMDTIPLPAHYHLWNQDALAKVLQEGDDLYKHDVLKEAQALLEALSD